MIYGAINNKELPQSPKGTKVHKAEKTKKFSE